MTSFRVQAGAQRQLGDHHDRNSIAVRDAAGRCFVSPVPGTGVPSAYHRPVPRQLYRSYRPCRRPSADPAEDEKGARPWTGRGRVLTRGSPGRGASCRRPLAKRSKRSFVTDLTMWRLVMRLDIVPLGHSRPNGGRCSQVTVTRRILVVYGRVAAAVEDGLSVMTAMVSDANEVFQQAGIEIVLTAKSKYERRHLFDVDVGECNEFGISPDQSHLFSELRSEVPSGRVLVVVARSVPGYAGCASPLPAEPSAIISHRSASRWTLAHEVGHLLGLGHVDQREYLMYRNTGTIAGIPLLSGEECATLRGSSLLSP